VCTCQLIIATAGEKLGNSRDKLRHTRSVAYSAELVVLNKHHISGGGAYLDCYPYLDCYQKLRGSDCHNFSPGIYMLIPLNMCYSILESSLEVHIAT